MRIVRLIKRNNYVSIYFDNNEYEKIHYEIAVKAGLRKNDELSDIQLKKLLEAEEEFTLKDSALRFLSIRPHSTFELRNKLLKKGFPKSKIILLLDDLKEREYLSDADFAERYIEEGIKKKKGIMKIKAELMNKGVDRNIIDSLTQSYADDAAFIQNAKLLAQKKMESLSRKDLPAHQKKQKLYSFLLNKGYSHEIVKQITNEII